jgi:4-alpha-glucanotransferase
MSCGTEAFPLRLESSTLRAQCPSVAQDRRRAERLAVLDRRRAGVLLHLGSLTAALGRGGRALIDWLADAGFSVWQILPLGPPDPNHSPYAGRSDFAGNHAYLDPSESFSDSESSEYDEFLQSNQHWLEDYALFEVLSATHGGAAWWTWRPELRERHPGTLYRVIRDSDAELERIKRVQFAFFVQWRRLRAYAHQRGVRVFGDLPFYVGPNCAETWAHRGLFQLDAKGRAIVVSGHPPDDFFCPSGQMWGHPLYDWDAMRRNGFKYWRDRVRQQLARVDLLRIDHFHGLAAHWGVPATAADAREGKWYPTPGAALLRTLREELRELPLAAEDLGHMPEEASILRRGFGFPGMRVLQFAYHGSEDNPHLPCRHESDSIVYTGTHDNDTTLGWYSSVESNTRKRIDRDVNPMHGAMPEPLIHQALASIGRLTVIPMQDILGLGTEARLNTPGTVSGENWRWKLPNESLTAQRAKHWRGINSLYGRL